MESIISYGAGETISTANFRDLPLKASKSKNALLADLGIQI